ncbi:hypothetical protein KXD93_07000 [Mucilaginibacter sp. BJC16-A38]|uniref:hypothetical protein n=1 Tax=Mucilaginibacter phenanthrenivorans TaxID=1234842 RepID=UPI0021587DEE|nr:hypothetical protein [Mucilaginibacter phenanthrenivorans]MCR8557382.1 hypothetical protein [Mucilaginibacter phenanthrenivorans]
MFKRITCGFLACLFLTGSLMLPLGDFSLLRDIPKMYQNYIKITSQEEADVIDFIGDYLMYGKQIFGHNEHDKTPDKGNEVQFQHQASPLNVLFSHSPVKVLIAPVAILTHSSFIPHFTTSDYCNELFRPPLA